MNEILSWLAGGDLRSDGDASLVAAFVLANPQVFEDLIEGLRVTDEVVRGRTADALEKIARSRADLLENHLPLLFETAKADSLPVVRMHLAMIFGHMTVYQQYINDLARALFDLLNDERVFVRSWAIVSLCIIARLYPEKNSLIINRIAPLVGDPSAAIRSRARKAMVVLTDREAPFSKGWVKSEKIQAII